jgi:hypothetical protein
MKRLCVLLLAVGFFFAGCKDRVPVTRDDFAQEVTDFEDSLKANAVDVNQLTDQDLGIKYAEKCLDFYHHFPKDKSAPNYLDKAHVIFASIGLHQRSVMLADTLIQNYPLYKNRSMVLESLASAYDVFIIPRRKDKVKRYYEMLLKESKTLTNEQRKDIEFRLQNIDLTFEELIQKQR